MFKIFIVAPHLHLKSIASFKAGFKLECLKLVFATPLGFRGQLQYTAIFDVKVFGKKSIKINEAIIVV